MRTIWARRSKIMRRVMKVKGKKARNERVWASKVMK